jgi:hypothetical protein
MAASGSIGIAGSRRGVWAQREVKGSQGKQFFFEKKNQKTFDYVAPIGA